VYPFTAITVYPSGISGALKYPIFRVVSKSTVGSILIIFNSNLPFNEVNQMAGAATRAPERSPHGLH
jgi:hypothetical protein